MIRKFFKGISDFLFEVRSELKKVSFPTRTETVGSTSVVLILVLIVSVFLSMVDHLLIRLVRIVIG